MIRNSLLSSVIVFGSVALHAAAAVAQDAPAPEPVSPPPGKIDLTTPPPTAPVGKIDLSTPAPAPAVQRSYHMHNGFYARASLGFGSLSASFDDNDPSGKDLSGSGATLGFELMLGGSPTPGLAIGGGFLAQGAFPTELERGGYEQDRSISAFIVGPFIDGFPNVNRGFHIGGLLGLAAVNVEQADEDGVSETMGFGGAVFLGYDFWVADEWSVGPTLRFAGTLTSNNDDDVDASTFSTLIGFTALYH